MNYVNRRTQLVSAPVELEKVPGMQGVHVEAATAAREQHGDRLRLHRYERANFASDTTHTALFILLLLL